MSILTQLKNSDADFLTRFREVKKEARSTRSSLYHLTNKCNLRCKGCWFFSNEFDKRSQEISNLLALEDFVKAEASRGINAPLLIGGEPTMFPERIAIYRKHMERVTISTNGLKALPKQGFDDITIAISVFGGGPLDDDLRAIGPNGKTFSGLFDKVLDNYRNDPRAGFVYAISSESIPFMEATVKRIGDNGLRLLFNYYTDYDRCDPLRVEIEKRLLDEALRLQAIYPEVISSHPFFIQALISGSAPWGKFGYDSCPSISQDYPGNLERLSNGNPVLAKFNAWSADLETTAMCCTSGECSKCRDSQAVMSWLLVNYKQFAKLEKGINIWTELAESYFSQFIWSKYHPYGMATGA